MITRVLVDANVLYSRTLRDWFLMLYVESEGGMFTAHWTEDIMAEAIYHLRRNNRSLHGAVVASLRDKVERVLEGGRVSEFPIDETFQGDPNDRHVHSAALACGATIVLTGDTRYRGDHDPDLLPYEVYQPDEFFQLVNASAPGLVARVTEKQARHYWERNGEADLCGRLEASDCPGFADVVRSHLQAIDISDWPVPSASF